VRRLAILGTLALAAVCQAQPGGGSLTLTVTETLGQRRFGYPVTALVPLPQGAARDTSQVALEGQGGAMRAVQYDARTRWPDGSVQWLAVSFNLSPGPLEAQKLQLKWGPEVRHPDSGAAVVQETPAAFVLRGVYRVPRTGGDFLESIRYGQREFLKEPARWTVERESAGKHTALPVVGTEASRVLGRGPLNAVVERTGAYQGARAKLPYRLTVAAPNSKSWFDSVLELENPERDLLRVSLTLPYVVEKDPALFDFGVGAWLYGTVRADAVATLFSPRKVSWFVTIERPEAPAADTARLQQYAQASREQPRFEGWGHLIDGAQGGRAVAFGSPDFARRSDPADGSISVSGKGLVTMRWTVNHDRKTRFQALAHHVGDPVHVTAVTSPAAMLNPLVVSLPDGWHRNAGVSPDTAPVR